MLTVYVFASGGMQKSALEADGSLPPNTVWIDMLEPTQGEERAVEAALGIDAPTREEMQEIEMSSRLYREDGAYFMTASILHHADTDAPENSAITFIRHERVLVTLRYADPVSFHVFPARAARASDLSATPDHVLLGLLDAISDRLADVLEHVGADLDALSKEIFRKRALGGGKNHPQNTDLEAVLMRLGRIEDLTSRATEAIVSLLRLNSFYGVLIADSKGMKDLRQKAKSVSRDLNSLQEHASSIALKGNFLLDATLGLINIEQTMIIKIFSVAAMVFLPPTLIASIYGMNFKFMPELEWEYGYFAALGLMILSAVLPYWYFKRRGWM